ncbi:MAG: prolyl oligopeptidase family serine peptidase [Gluconacetobacter diazotrophicus]|nr:prolyl oligopeptidase family serine peptidase [Gluconacetobacter diazotrophicus]
MPAKPFFLTLAVLLLAASGLHAEARGWRGGGEFNNFVYGQAGGHDLKLDLYLPTRQGSPDACSRVQAVCDVSGPMDLAIPTYSLVGELCVYWELRVSPHENPALYRHANPAQYIRGGEPPFLIVQGDADPLVLPENTRILATALRSHGDRVTVDTVPGAKHIPIGDPQRQEIATFFKNHPG